MNSITTRAPHKATRARKFASDQKRARRSACHAFQLQRTHCAPAVVCAPVPRASPARRRLRLASRLAVKPRHSTETSLRKPALTSSGVRQLLSEDAPARKDSGTTGGRVAEEDAVPYNGYGAVRPPDVPSAVDSAQRRAPVSTPAGSNCSQELKRLCCAGPYSAAWQLYRDAVDRGQRLDSSVYHTLMQAAFKARRPHDAVEAFDDNRRSWGGARPYLYTTLISGLLKCARPGSQLPLLAYEYWLELRGSHQQLDAGSFRAGIHACVVLGRLQEAEGLLDVMRAAGVHADARAYNLLMKFYRRRGDPEAARKLFRRMRSLGIQPDLVTYNTLMQTFVASGQLVRARAVLDKARRERVPLDVWSYTTLIQGYAAARDVGAAVAVLEEMRHVGVQPNEVTYGALINCLAQADDAAGVEDLLQQMQRQGLRPTAHIHNSILLRLCNSGPGGLQRALQHLRKLTQGGFVAGADTYTILIEAAVAVPDLPTALALAQQMLQSGIQPDAVALTALMNAFVAAQRTEDAVACFGEMLSSPATQPDLAAWSSLVHALANAGRMADAEQVLDRAAAMAARLGLPPPQPAFGAIIRGYRRLKMCDAAIECLRRYLQQGGRPHKAMADDVISMCLQQGKLKTAMQIIRAMELTGTSIDEQRYQSWFREHQKAEDGGSEQPHSLVERIKWWLGLPNTYYRADWR